MKRPPPGSSLIDTMRRLYRSQHQRLFLGVCGGIAERYRWDPTWVRLAFVLATLAGGPGIVLYAVMALVVPGSPALSSSSRAALAASRR